MARPACGGFAVLYLVLLAALIAVVFSSKWLGYEYELYTSGLNDRVMPMRYGSGAPQDDYYYYARVREIIDGDFLAFDPVLRETRTVPNLHSSYHFSFFPAAIGGLLDGSTKSAFYFNNAFFPALNFFLLFAIIYHFTRAFFLSIAFAVIAVLFSFYYSPQSIAAIIGQLKLPPSDAPSFLRFTQVNRMPNLMVTGVHLSLLVIVLALAVKRGAGCGLGLASAALLAVAPLVSVHNFLLSLGLTGSVMLFECLGRATSRWWGVTLITASVAALPGIWVLNRAKAVAAEWMAFSLLTEDIKNNPVNLDSIQLWTIHFLIAGAVVALGGSHNRRFLMAMVTAAILVYFILTFLWGSFFAELAMVRGAALMLAAAVAVGTSGLLRRAAVSVQPLLPRKARVSSSSRAARGLLYVMPVAFLIWIAPSAYLVDSREYSLEDYLGGEFSDLADWTRDATTVRDVAVTLDFYVLTNLPTYSPINIYVPQAQQSSAGAEERMRRFFEAARFYGLTPGDMDRMLAGMTSHYDLPYETPEQRQQALMQLVLFYGKHVRKRMSEEERAALVERYRAVLAEEAGLSWQADYLILSSEDRKLVRPESAAARTTMTRTPVYDDGVYAVYPLKD